MRILWVTTNFLHPTTRGGKIRTLEMLRRLHRRHEIHFVAIEDPREPEGPARAPEYATRAYPFQHRGADKRWPAFVLELSKSVLDSEPLSIRRFHPPAMASAAAFQSGGSLRRRHLAPRADGGTDARGCVSHANRTRRAS